MSGEGAFFICYHCSHDFHTAALTQNHPLQQPPQYNGRFILPQTGCNGEVLITLMSLSWILCRVLIFFFPFLLSNQDPGTDTYWMIYDKATGKPTPLGVDSYKPQDDSTTIFRLVTGASHEEATAGPTVLGPSSSQGKLVGLGLGTMCLLAGLEALLFL